jgi:ERCC4-related helicase
MFFGREVCSAGIGGNHIKKENEKSLIKEALTKLHNDEITWVVGTSALLKGHDTTVGMVIEFSPLSSFIEQKQYAGRAGREKGERRLPVRYVIFSAGSFEERAALIGRYKMRRKD